MGSVGTRAAAGLGLCSRQSALLCSCHRARLADRRQHRRQQQQRWAAPGARGAGQLAWRLTAEASIKPCPQKGALMPPACACKSHFQRSVPSLTLLGTLVFRKEIYPKGSLQEQHLKEQSLMPDICLACSWIFIHPSEPLL